MSNPLCGNAGGNGTETWFPRFGCQPSDILAIGDFTKGDYKIYTRSSLAEPFSTTGIAPSGASSFDSIQSTNFFANGAKIMTSGQNLSYPPGEIDAQI